MIGWLHHWLFLDYWVPTWPNAGAVPLCALAAAIGTLVFRRPLERLARRVRDKALGPVHARLDEIHKTALAAHRIAADTHRHVTGRDHPDAP